MKTNRRYPFFCSLKKTDHIVVLSPHSDDEVLALGGLLHQAKRIGARVSVVFVTNGDGNYFATALGVRKLRPTASDYRQAGLRRQEEALAALKQIGLAIDDVHFMGLPDRGMSRIVAPKHEETAYRSKTTNASRSMYKNAAVPDLPYTGNAARTALRAILHELKPTFVFGPAPFDRHTDHRAVACLMNQTVRKLPGVQCYRYLIHQYTPWFYRTYPLPRGKKPDLPLLPPKRKAALQWEIVALTDEDIACKQAAIETYRSQHRLPELGALMRSLIRQNELVVADELLS